MTHNPLYKNHISFHYNARYIRIHEFGGFFQMQSKMISMKTQVGLYSWGNEYFCSGIGAEVQTTSDWNEENPASTNNNQDRLISHSLSARPWGVTAIGKNFSTPALPAPWQYLAVDEDQGVDGDGPITSMRIS